VLANFGVLNLVAVIRIFFKLAKAQTFFVVTNYFSTKPMIPLLNRSTITCIVGIMDGFAMLRTGPKRQAQQPCGHTE
jgi:hypothetical protein